MNNLKYYPFFLVLGFLPFVIHAQIEDSLVFTIHDGPYTHSYSEVFGNDTTPVAGYIVRSGTVTISLQMGTTTYNNFEIFQFVLFCSDPEDMEYIIDSTEHTEGAVAYFHNPPDGIVPTLIAKYGVVNLTSLELQDNGRAANIEGDFEIYMFEYPEGSELYTVTGHFSNKGNLPPP